MEIGVVRSVIWAIVVAVAGCASPAPGPIGPAGTLLVLNKGEGTVSVLDVAARREIARVAVGSGPHEVAISPDRRWAVVSNYGQQVAGDSLSVIELSNSRVVRTISLRDASDQPLLRPHGLQFVDAQRVVVTVEGRQAIALVHVGSGRVERVMVTGQAVSHMVAVASARWAYVANIGSGNVTQVDLQLGEAIRHVSTGKGAEGIAVTPNGAQVWVSNRGDDSLSVLDAAELRELARLAAPGFPIRVVFSPDGKRALVTAPRADTLLVFDVATRALERRIELPKAEVKTEGRLLGAMFGGSSVPIGVTTDAAGRYAFVAQANADTVSIIDLMSGAVVGRLPAGIEPDGIAWLPSR